MFSFLNKSISENSKTFFDFKINSIDGQELDLSIYKDKTLLIVNVASKCGFTKQYDELQNLYELYSEKGLIVLAVPSNSVNQEKSNNEDIKEFCEVNFNINFPMSTKYDVKGENAHEVYKWAK